MARIRTRMDIDVFFIFLLFEANLRHASPIVGQDIGLTRQPGNELFIHRAHIDVWKAHLAVLVGNLERDPHILPVPILALDLLARPQSLQRLAHFESLHDPLLYCHFTS